VIIMMVISAWLLAGVVAGLVSGDGVANALGLVALANLPALVALATLNEVSRLSNVPPPFPYVYGVAAGLIAAIALADILAALVISGRGGRSIGRAVSLWRRTRRSGVRGASAKPVALRPGPGADLAASAISGYRDWSKARALSRVAGMLVAHWDAVAVSGIAAVMGALLSYRLDYEALWQDEATSALVANQIRAHGLPIFPSGVWYLKGELYHYLIAAVGLVTGNGPVPLRAVSVAWFVLTVLALGFLLLPAVLPPGKWLRVAVVLFFITTPIELTWARDIRMYQQAQVFTIIFAAVFLGTLKRPTTKNIAASMALLVALYLSHELGFVILPGVAVVFLATQRLRWVRDWRWWVFGGAAVAVIVLQFLLSNYVHPAYLGSDISNKPYVTFDPSDIWWYLRNIYFPVGIGGNLTLVSTLALVALAVGIRRRLWTRLYLSALVWIPVVMLSVMFSAKSGRYTFVTLPFLFVLGSLGAFDLLGFARRTLGGQVTRVGRRRLIVGATRTAAVLGVVWLMLSVTGGLRSYGLAVARLTGTPYSHLRRNYENMYPYFAANVRPGDKVMTAAPAIIFSHYTGREPDMILVRAKAKLLYIFDRNGQPVDTVFGKPTLLTTNDLRRALSQYPRIWLFADQAALNGLSTGERDLVLRTFIPKAQSESGTLYLWQL
jgi:hypothetical protein